MSILWETNSVICRFLAPVLLESLLYNRSWVFYPSLLNLSFVLLPSLLLFNFPLALPFKLQPSRSDLRERSAAGCRADVPGQLQCPVLGISERNFSEVFSSLTLDVSSHCTPWVFTKAFVQAKSSSKVKFRQWKWEWSMVTFFKKPKTFFCDLLDKTVARKHFSLVFSLHFLSCLLKHELINTICAITVCLCPPQCIAGIFSPNCLNSCRSDRDALCVSKCCLRNQEHSETLSKDQQESQNVWPLPVKYQNGILSARHHRLKGYRRCGTPAECGVCLIAAFLVCVEVRKAFYSVVITQGVLEYLSVMFSHNTISHVCSWKSHVVPHSGNCISSAISNVLHLLSDCSSVSEQGAHAWGDLWRLSGEGCGFEWSQAGHIRTDSVWLLCFSTDAERKGVGVSALGGCYRAFDPVC